MPLILLFLWPPCNALLKSHDSMIIIFCSVCFALLWLEMKMLGTTLFEEYQQSKSDGWRRTEIEMKEGWMNRKETEWGESVIRRSMKSNVIKRLVFSNQKIEYLWCSNPVLAQATNYQQLPSEFSHCFLYASGSIFRGGV